MARRMPTSDEIEDLAKKLYWLDHPESMGITPEKEELSEGNYLIKARDLLMRGEEGPILAEYDRMVHEWAKAVSEDAEKLGFVLVPKKDWEKMRPEDVAKVYEELELVKAREKKWKKKLEEKEIAEAEYKKQMEQEISELKKRIAELTEVKPPAPPKPPEVKPPPAPPVKVLPEVPEKCPIDGSPISEVSRVPIGPVPVRLSPDEEYMRARLGLPIPEREIVWLDVPPTMKLYHCSEDHLFERDPTTGRLVQRTPEYVYRKILRETAALRKVVYPEVAAPPTPAPVYYYPPPPPRPMRLQDTWWDWVERVKGLTREQFMALSWEEKERIRKEWGEWVKRTGAG